MHNASSDMLHVAVLMGGWSHEREISLLSGANMYSHLAPARYSRRALDLVEPGCARLRPPDGALDALPWERVPGMPLLRAFDELLDWGVDVAVIALHGSGGEDGTLQGFLQTLGIPYTHSGVRGSAVSMDKILSKQVYHACGIPTPASVVVHAGDEVERMLADAGLALPVVVKPPCLGSSFEVFIVHKPHELHEAVAHLLTLDARVLVEQYIPGRELTCCVFQPAPNAPPRALPVTEIVPVDSSFFDFRAKYTAGASREITPAEIDAALTVRVQELACHCHTALHCESVSRTDLMLAGNGELLVLETNAIPGMTETSLLPQAAAAVGMSLEDVLDAMIAFARSRHAIRM
jgi:D-alanine-D-alanine ligase